MESITFTPSHPNTLGIELELQLIHAATFDLCEASDELLAHLAEHRMAERVKPEITRAMIELNSSVHDHPAGLLTEMREMRDVLCTAADAVGVGVCGGGLHPFMHWQHASVSDTPRYQHLAEMYGYLARQFTVFGQHIHIGVTSGDEAITLTRRLSAYVPHMIAMAAASPYTEGVDTLFSCARLNVGNSFPLAGHIPADIVDWRSFDMHVAQLFAMGLAGSLKDLYWHVRPKPEFGTVELRICDTPLTIDRACQLAAFAQALSVLVMRSREAEDNAWVAYRSNVFQACRFGVQGNYVTPQGERTRLTDHLRDTFARLIPVAEELGTVDMVAGLRDDMLTQGSGADWMRFQFHKSRSLPMLVQEMGAQFRGINPQAGFGQRRRIRANSEPLIEVQKMTTSRSGALRLH